MTARLSTKVETYGQDFAGLFSAGERCVTTFIVEAVVDRPVQQSAMTAIPEGEDFRQAWTNLSRSDRLRLRRLVRMGRPLEDDREAAVAVAYARFQRSRVWVRLFWLWFLPSVVLALGVASKIHPIVLGAVLALAAQAVYARWNLLRVERTNAAVLGLARPPDGSGRHPPRNP